MTETDHSIEPAQQSSRFGYAAVIGPPNAGKSTLVNALVGQKISIVTHKAHTTRMPVAGIACIGDTQVVLSDTAGWISPQRQIERAMMGGARRRMREADCRIVVADAARYDVVASLTASLLAASSMGADAIFVVLNKIDRVRRANLLPLAQSVAEISSFARLFMISALSGDGVDDLRRALGEGMPLGAWRYDVDQAADMPLRMMASELTREALLMRLNQEIPHALAVATESWRERRDESISIEQIIHVERASQRAIIIGHRGQTLRAIGMGARREMARQFGRTVHLRLNIRLQPGWRDKPSHLSGLASGREAC